MRYKTLEIRKTKRSGEGEGKANLTLWTKVEVMHEGIKLPRKGFVSTGKLNVCCKWKYKYK